MKKKKVISKDVRIKKEIIKEIPKSTKRKFSPPAERTNGEYIKTMLAPLAESSNKPDFYLIVADLRQAFLRGYNIAQACLYSGINVDTYREWRKKSVDFALMMDKAQHNLPMVVKDKVATRIMGGDMKIIMWFAERQMKDEFSTRQELTGADGERLYPQEIDLSKLTIAELKLLKKLVQKASVEEK